MLILSALWSIETNAQSTSGTTNWAFGDFLGYNGTTHNLDFGFGTGPAIFMNLLTSGDLNISNGANGYMINGNYVLLLANLSGGLPILKRIQILNFK